MNAMRCDCTLANSRWVEGLWLSGVCAETLNTGPAVDGVMVIKVRRLREEPGDMERELGASEVNYVDVVLKRGVAAFSSRLLRIQPGGHTAYHSHPREHVALVISGMVRVEVENESAGVQEAHVVTIPANTPHRFVNPGPHPLALLVLNMFPEEPEPATPAEMPVQEPTQESAPRVEEPSKEPPPVTEGV